MLVLGWLVKGSLYVAHPDVGGPLSDPLAHRADVLRQWYSVPRGGHLVSDGDPILDLLCDLCEGYKE